jgi:hypothetical protein
MRLSLKLNQLTKISVKWSFTHIELFIESWMNDEFLGSFGDRIWPTTVHRQRVDQQVKAGHVCLIKADGTRIE